MVNNAVSFVNESGQTENYTVTYDNAQVTKVRELNPKTKIAGVYLSTDCPSGSSNTCYMIGVDYKITGAITNNATSTTKDIQIEGMRYILFEKTSEGIVITRTHNTSANYTVCTDDNTAGCSSSEVSFTVPTASSLVISAVQTVEMAIEIIQETFDTSGSLEAEVITEVPAETDGNGS